MLKNYFLTILLAVFTFSNIQAQHEKQEPAAVAHEPGNAHNEHSEEKFDMNQMIMHHLLDAHSWEYTHTWVVSLPVILYTKENGLDIFLSSKFDNETGVYKNYKIEHEHIHLMNPDGSINEEAHIWNFSITKNVAQLMFSAILLILIFTAVNRGYQKNKGKAPKGIQSFLEPVIVMIKDEAIKPNIGEKYERYVPYLLTLFFFILINNLLGLTPGSANLTGNIAVTLTLAIFTFIIVHANAKKDYWMHILWTPGVPLWLKPLFLVIETVGMFVKPASLTIRLFANITGGHIILLSLLGLIFMFESYAVGFGVTVLGTFMTLIEILVAFIQAYIFTMLTSMYIGSAIAEHHEEH